MPELRAHGQSPHDRRPACTAAEPAPQGKPRWGFYAWDHAFCHADALGRCIDDDHDDWRYECPHCGCIWIYEGPDA